MKSFHFSLDRAATIALTVVFVFVLLSVIFTNHLAHRMAIEEMKSIEIWAEATRQFIQADENTNVDFVSSIIEENTTIPVYMLDSDGQILQTRNVRRPVKDPTLLNGPIEVRIADDLVQYIYYDDSSALRQLRVLPYIEFSLIVLFMVIALLALYLAERSEQSRVWAGLSKETAHQLGTPVSSLLAWKELLQARYPEDELIPRMQTDIERLQAITDRFSKIGSEPELHETAVLPIVEETVAYMRMRISKRVKMDYLWGEEDRQKQAMLSVPLFEWVIENLIRNAVDAMNGVGEIHLTAQCQNDMMCIDVKDTGCGIEKRLYNRIFRPGYTSKKRGWGLGLSLCRRIMEEYHNGKIFVLQSQLGAGTTFRIQIRTLS